MTPFTFLKAPYAFVMTPYMNLVLAYTFLRKRYISLIHSLDISDDSFREFSGSLQLFDEVIQSKLINLNINPIGKTLVFYRKNTLIKSTILEQTKQLTIYLINHFSEMFFILSKLVFVAIDD